MYHKQTIEKSPLQTYVSALIFSPCGSLVRDLFMEEEPNWISIKPAMSEKWSPCLQTLEGHDEYVTSVAFSHNMKFLASASGYETIKIWDPYDGQCL
jgi:WD40 repeat protein